MTRAPGLIPNPLPCNRGAVVMPATRARALILPVVLVVVGLLALTMAGFIFFVKAETAGMIAHGDAQQARLATESGLEEIIATLRAARHDSTAWFNVPARFRNALVWSASYKREEDPIRESRSRAALFEEGVVRAAAWRYSAVAADMSGLADTMRYGITPEAGKLNINVASDAQIETLLLPVLTALQIENPYDLINAALDWRDDDDDPRAGGAENEYYNTLEPPYNAKNAPFDTIEELLLVKGFSAAVLYGEDVNRNGYLDPNEDDGDASFPEYDNGDGVLDRGIAPYITIWSREPDTALDNKPRINLSADAGIIAALIAQQFQNEELSEATVSFILGLKQQNFNFQQAGSPAVLYYEPPLDAEEGGAGGNDPLAASPVTLAEMPFIMDRFSARQAAEGAQIVMGLININTAPFQVLMTVPGMTAEAAEAIVATRAQLDGTALATTAWPLTSQVVDAQTFQQIAPFITTKAYQFHVEVLGYADHVKLFQRREWIIEMVGSLAQIKYDRDLTALGFAWPVDDDSIVVTNP